MINLNDHSGSQDDFPAEIINSSSNMVTEVVNAQEKLKYEDSSRNSKGSPKNELVERPKEENAAVINNEMLIELNGQNIQETSIPPQPVNTSVNEELFNNSGSFVEHNTALPPIEESKNIPPPLPEPRNVVSELFDIVERKAAEPTTSKVQRVAEILPEG